MRVWERIKSVGKINKIIILIIKELYIYILVMVHDMFGGKI